MVHLKWILFYQDACVFLIGHEKACIPAAPFVFFCFVFVSFQSEAVPDERGELDHHLSGVGRRRVRLGGWVNEDHPRNRDLWDESELHRQAPKVQGVS